MVHDAASNVDWFSLLLFIWYSNIKSNACHSANANANLMNATCSRRAISIAHDGSTTHPSGAQVDVSASAASPFQCEY